MDKIAWITNQMLMDIYIAQRHMHIIIITVMKACNKIQIKQKIQLKK